ncbi:MAG: methyltransferase domain-containing protein [Gammaproteobacteria bacterium]|nr:methyltransferase domain-containing protein [Gammaproteobacteria bacterium]
MNNEVAATEDEDRFAFGRNWSQFLEGLDDEKLRVAAEALMSALGGTSLAGKRFLDIGCGSGIVSLTARQLGATVVSFDYDKDSVGCAEKLRERYFADDPDWAVSQGSVLDAEFVKSLGEFDIVYSWGVLHHTGDMWTALANVVQAVAPQGRLFISIYNDQAYVSRWWTRVKRTYVRLPEKWRWLVVYPSFLVIWGPQMLIDLVKLQPMRAWREYSIRGMSPWNDLIDWVGGYPFEVAKPEEIFDFYRDRGFELQHLQTCGGGKGCNEFVFQRSAP